MSDDEFLKGDEAETPMDILLVKHRKEKKDLKVRQIYIIVVFSINCSFHCIQ